MDDFLVKVAQIESYGGKVTVGDNGRSRGPYHMGKAAWDDNSKRRTSEGLPIISWSSGTKTTKWSKLYAEDHARWIARQLSRKRIKVTEQTLYLAWNAGLSVALKVGGDFSRLGPVMKERLSKFSGESFEVQ